MTQAGTSAAGRPGVADVLRALWRRCWPGGCAAGPADVVRAHGGQDELECAASPVDVLLALRGRAAVRSPAAGQGENSKAVTLKLSLTQSSQPAEGPGKTL